MPQFLSPVCNDQMFDVNGDPLNGGQVETYIAGSATPAATYTSSAGTVQQANPIILNSLGKTSSPIWLAAGVAYKFVVKDSSGVSLWTIDGISGVNDASVSVSEWVDSGFVPTYISATSFSVPGDQTGILQVGRRLKTVNTSGVIYSGISASVFGSGVTTVTVLNDSGTLDAGLSSLAYGLISADNTSFPFATFAAASTIAVSNDDATNAAHYLLFADGTAGQENVKTGTSKLKYNPSTGRLDATQFKGEILPDSLDLTNVKATTAQAQAGSDDSTVMTPAKTRSAVDSRFFSGAGSIGSYAFLFRAAPVNFGDLVNGSELRASGVLRAGDGVAVVKNDGQVQTGVWRAMGSANSATGSATIYQRVS